LKAVKEIPEKSIYRKNVEALTKYRMGLVEQGGTIKEIEQRFGLGRLEEVLEHAKDELELIPEMIKGEPWATKDPSTVKIEIVD